MKKLIALAILLNLSLTAFSQTDTSNKKPTQEPVKCLPVSTFKEIAKDLLKGDSAKAELKLANEQIVKLEEKVSLKDSVIVTMQQKEENYKTIIGAHEQKFSTLENYTKSVELKLKKEKVKNKFKSFIGGTLVAVLTVMLIVK